MYYKFLKLDSPSSFDSITDSLNIRYYMQNIIRNRDLPPPAGRYTNKAKY